MRTTSVAALFKHTAEPLNCCYPKAMMNYHMLNLSKKFSTSSISGTSDNNEDSSTLKNSSEFPDVPGVQTSGDKMIIMFTCTVCDTRSARKISKQAYEHGIVMVRCSGCNNRHLIADRMGVFEDSIESSGPAATSKGGVPGSGWDIRQYLSTAFGQESKYITDENVYELTMEDIVGAQSAKKNEETPSGDHETK
jgi:hypothetical protein